MAEEFIRSTDPRFGEMNRIAEALFDIAFFDIAQPGHERQQAAHFAITAVANEAKLDLDETVSLIAAVVGSISAGCPHPHAVRLEIFNRSEDFFLDALARRHRKEAN